MADELDEGCELKAEHAADRFQIANSLSIEGNVQDGLDLQL
jgi:hypothetical protein